jgi:hypothetical protein
MLSKIAHSRKAKIRLAWGAISLIALMLLTDYCAATPSQEDVLKSISENVSHGSSGNGTMFLWVLLGAIGLILLLALLNSRGQREEAPKTFNHEGKLLKELMKELAIKPAEWKQLKLLADGEREAGNDLGNPLVFLLCPSLMVSAAKAQRVKYDRKILAGLAAKLGLTAAPRAKR